MTYLTNHIKYSIYERAFLLNRVINRALYRVIILPPCSPGVPPWGSRGQRVKCCGTWDDLGKTMATVRFVVAEDWPMAMHGCLVPSHFAGLEFSKMSALM